MSHLKQFDLACPEFSTVFGIFAYKAIRPPKDDIDTTSIDRKRTIINAKTTHVGEARCPDLVAVDVVLTENVFVNGGRVVIDDIDAAGIHGNALALIALK